MYFHMKETMTILINFKVHCVCGRLQCNAGWYQFFMCGTLCHHHRYSTTWKWRSWFDKEFQRNLHHQNIINWKYIHDSCSFVRKYIWQARRNEVDTCTLQQILIKWRQGIFSIYGSGYIWWCLFISIFFFFAPFYSVNWMNGYIT